MKNIYSIVRCFSLLEFKYALREFFIIKKIKSVNSVSMAAIANKLVATDWQNLLDKLAELLNCIN